MASRKSFQSIRTTGASNSEIPRIGWNAKREKISWGLFSDSSFVL